MFKQNAIASRNVVLLAIIDGNPIGKKFGNTIRRSWVKR